MKPQQVTFCMWRQVLPRLLLLGMALANLPAILVGNQLSAQRQTSLPANPARQPEVKIRPDAWQSGVGAGDASTQPRTAPKAVVEVPLLPDKQSPNRARVSWDGGNLTIEASNSSLEQILHQVAAITGARLEGPIRDQRVFGTYGPGPGCDVLSKLLAGSGENVVMLGSREAGAPLAIVLSARLPASTLKSANQGGSSNPVHGERAEQLEPEPRPEALRSQGEAQNPFSNGEPTPHDSVAFMQEILERQQKIDLQQQKQQQEQQTGLPQR